MTFLFLSLMLLAVYQFTASVCALSEHGEKTFPPGIMHIIMTSWFCPLFVFAIAVIGMLVLWKRQAIPLAPLG